MARLRKADQGLVFTSSILNENLVPLAKARDIWRERYDLSGEVQPEFSPSLKYYSKEMGEGLKRIFFWSNTPHEREELVEGKLWADRMEQSFAQNGKRAINIDIGMLFKEQLLLATSKPYAHRIYLSDGVWAELTYTYENKSYHFLPWTYPDYQSPEKVELFNSLRLGLFSK